MGEIIIILSTVRHFHCSKHFISIILLTSLQHPCKVSENYYPHIVDWELRLSEGGLPSELMGEARFNPGDFLIHTAQALSYRQTDRQRDAKETASCQGGRRLGGRKEQSLLAGWLAKETLIDSQVNGKVPGIIGL